MKQVFAAFVVILALAFVAAPAGAETFTWNGAVGSQSWSTASNWAGGAVPGASDTAYFKRQAAGRYVFAVTPPADFAGTITSTNYATGVSSAYQCRYFSVVLELGVAEGAAWTVTGTGDLVATPGLADRISPDFAGVIDVRKGTTFVVPATLNNKVTLVGAGRVVLASAAQLSQVALFAGEVVLPSGASFACSGPSALAARSVVVPDGATLSFSEADLAVNHTGSVLAPGDAPDAWSFNGGGWYADPATSLGYAAATGPARLDGDGSLLLTDDAAQLRTAWYTNRVFRYTDDWGIRFRWSPELPTDSAARAAGRGQVLSGNFGIGFQRVSPTNVTVKRDNRQEHALKEWGFFVTTYRGDNPQNQGISWICDGAAGAKFGERVLEAQLGGVKLNAPVDFTVGMSGGKMAVTMEQGENSCTFTWDFATASEILCAGGYWLGFSASSDDWGTNANVPWCRHRVSGFSGWYRDPLDGGWESVANESAFSPSLASNWYVNCADRNNDQKSYAAVNADGSFQFLNAPSNGVCLISNAAVPTDKRLKVSFALRGGKASFTSGTGGMGLGFLLGSNNQVTRTLNTWADASGYPYNQFVNSWSYGFGFAWNLYSGLAWFSTDHLSNDAKDGRIQSASFAASRTNGRDAADQRIRMDFVYDPAGSISGTFSQEPGSAYLNGYCSRFVWELNDTQKANLVAWRKERTPSIGIRASSGPKNYIELALTDVGVKQMTSLDGGRIPGSLRVADGASATVRAGDAMDGQTSPVMSLGDIALGAGAVLSVVPETSATIVAVDGATASGEATIAAASGAAVSIGTITLDGNPGETSLTATGDISFPAEGFAVTVPDEWLAASSKIYGRRVVATAPAFPRTARIVTRSGDDVTEAAHLLVSATGEASIDFLNGFVLIVR